MFGLLYVIIIITHKGIFKIITQPNINIENIYAEGLFFW